MMERRDGADFTVSAPIFRDSKQNISMILYRFGRKEEVSVRVSRGVSRGEAKMNRQQWFSYFTHSSDATM